MEGFETKHSWIPPFELAILKILIQSLYSTSIVCIFLIHSGSAEKMLTALFKLVWNTQKVHMDKFF